MDEFSPEQRIMMHASGHPDPESVVRAEPVAAALMGSHLAPVLEKMAKAATEALESYLRLRKARRQRIMREALAVWVCLCVLLILWWPVIAALRWVL